MATKTGIYYIYTGIDNIEITLDANFNIDNLPILNITRTLSERYYRDPANILGHRSGYIGGGLFTVSSFTIIDNGTIEITVTENIDEPTFTISGYNALENNYIQEGALIFVDDTTNTVHGVNYSNETFTDEHEYNSWEIDGSEAYLNGDYNYIAQLSGNTLTLYTQELLLDRGNEELIQCDYELSYTASEKEPDPDEPEPEIYYHQTIKVKYQNTNGTYGEEEIVIDDDYLVGSTVFWSRPADAEYQNASILYIVEKEETKTVKVDRNKTYIYYDGNGGRNIPSTQSALYGATITISSTIPTKYGYNFLGWSSGSSLYQPSSSIILKESITLVAEWEKPDQEIYLYKNGNCYAKEFIEEENIGFGIGGEIYNPCFNEIDYSGNYKISDTKFIALSFIEGLPKEEKGE